MPEAVKKLPKLTIKQTKFVKHYIKSGNGTQSALVAYDTTSPKTAHGISTDNLQKPSVQEAVAKSLLVAGLDLTTLATEAKTLAMTQIDPTKVSADTKLRTIVELWKLTGAYPDRKTAHLNLNIKGNIKDLTFQEAKRELEAMNNGVNDFMKDAE